ncbi:MAG: hypothetical protein QG622_2399 [Actinomycetota bacterium]|nr:hypothetical protein [Actinomycetota bacterium]
MTELLPTRQAHDVRQGLLDYLTTTFALADQDARLALSEFLEDQQDGIFKGPYVRLRLPFRPADHGWQAVLDWRPPFEPYGHQAAAFRRLSSADLGPAKPRPLPTLVTTGTGSGKTEAFLVPILDHVLRERRAGRPDGIKALVLYPMNALANDQAARLAALLTGHAELKGLTAGLYTGQQGPSCTTVSPDGLITDRAVLRQDPPDILLTNYKMLDQLLLRPDDQGIWRAGALSLRYLVLDEFHTYDGAQGTDVAMLLRRLGIALKSWWPVEHPLLGEAERARPLGLITPVATSATLGDRGDPAAMVAFAREVFGEDLDESCVVAESRLGLDEWAGGADAALAALPVPRGAGSERAGGDRLDVLVPGALDSADFAGLVDRVDGAVARAAPAGRDIARALADEVLAVLYDAPPETIAALDDAALLVLAQAHPLVRRLVALTEAAGHVDDLALALFPVASAGDERAVRARGLFLLHLVAMLSHVRARVGRGAASVEAHLWVRELTRIDRVAASTAKYLWSDDGAIADGSSRDPLSWEGRPPFPAVYCRHCGRSGWGVGLGPVGSGLDAQDDTIRRNHAAREGRFRALLYAPLEAERAWSTGEEVEGLRWFAVRRREILTAPPDDGDPDFLDGWVLPVLTLTGPDADEDSRADVCPSCQQDDGIRFLGSAIATLLSVTLSTLFNDAHLDAPEKKALVFTDSVQDAAHRAGFVQSRSHTLTLRSVLLDAIGDQPIALDDLVEEALRAAGDDPFHRYRIVPPTLADRTEFRGFWQARTLRAVSPTVRKRVKSRLLFDAVLEFGLQSRIGRTLEATGSVVAEVSAAGVGAAGLGALGRGVLARSQEQALPGVRAPSDADLVAWVRGVLERMRERGAVHHPWLDQYIQEDGARYRIWGGRVKGQGMPAFPQGRSAPAFPRVGKPLQNRQALLDPVTSAQSWYARWTARTLHVSAQHGARLAKALLERLAAEGILRSFATRQEGVVYAIPHESVLVSRPALERLEAGECLLECAVCRNRYPGTPTVVEQLDGQPCMLVRCPGVLRRTPQPDNYYRRLYASGDPRRIVAREHSSLLDDATRVTYETQFRTGHDDPTAPNVLVATPTLEMGIDIGDLSAVMLSSLPRTVASYLQRVGRAGRLTGNALDLAFVTGRGEHLPRLGDPLSVVNGRVRPPATYLNAEEILQRQYLAHLVDELARRGDVTPQQAEDVLGRIGPGSFLDQLVTLAENEPGRHLDRFLGTFEDLTPTTVETLRAWATRTDEPGTSGLAAQVAAVAGRWARDLEELHHRKVGIEGALPGLEEIAGLPAATEDDRRALQSARAARRLIRRQIVQQRSQFWVQALEEHGLLPNYTLIDDAVTLDVAITWIDPETQEYLTDQVGYRRGSANALREFAPGAVFYGQGLEIEIDSVDLGYEENAVRPWAFCPDCGYAVDRAVGADLVAVPSCPRCGGTGIADARQHLDVVELTRVSAELRRDEAAITDRRDDRRRERFSIFVAADVDPAAVHRQWYLEQYDFGLKYLRRMDIRWVNAGRVAGYGTPTSIGGLQRPANLFRVCSGCGKLDRSTRANRPDEHRAWCRHRRSSEEHTRSLALLRSLRTQGVLLRLPRSVTIGDVFALPSLSAALLLGLREQLGGTPDHLAVVPVTDPSYEPGGGATPEALLVHDVVPGGTGYLAELADPERLWHLLHRAYVLVRDCPCADEPRLACHRCLLPFAGGLHPVDLVSRQTAERHLRAILTSGRTDVEPASWETDGWSTTDVPPGPDTTESHLEQHFRTVFRDRAKALGATVKDIPWVGGNRLQITFPGGNRTWTLDPQVLLHGCKPDFVLRTTDTGVPDVAIFADGRLFHASVEHNRLADDARKRRDLREEGFLVLAVTAADVEAAAVGGSAPQAPPWFREEVVASALQTGQFAFSAQAVEAIISGPFAFLSRWLQQPDPEELAQLANTVPLFFLVGAQPVPVPPGSLAEAAATLLGGAVRSGAVPSGAVPQGDTPPGDTTALWWRPGRANSHGTGPDDGPLGVLVRIDQGHGTLSADLAVVIDDRDDALTEPGHDSSWREWLRISNVLNGRIGSTAVTTVTTVTQVLADRADTGYPTGQPTGYGTGHGTTSATAPRDAVPAIRLSPAWQEQLDNACSPTETALIHRLAEHGSIPVPAVGHESEQGIIIDIAWPTRKIAVLVDPSPLDRQDLETAGWRVFDPDLELLLETLGEPPALAREEAR